MIGIMILVIGILIFTRNAFRMEKISRWEALVVPIYSLVMGVRTLLEAHPPVIWIAVTVVVGLLAAVIQASGAQLQVTGERDRHDRPRALLRRGGRYLIGWVLIFAYGIAMAMMFGDHVNLVREIGLEITKDLFSFRNFTTAASWNIYLQSGIASLSYTWLLIRQEPLVGQALRRQHQ